LGKFKLIKKLKYNFMNKKYLILILLGLILASNAYAQNGFLQETAELKYSKTWVTTITCKSLITGETKVFGNTDPYTLTTLVSNTIKQKNLPFTAPTQPIVRYDNGTGSINKWNNDGNFDLNTLNAVCSILGYDNYVSSACLDYERSAKYPNGKCNFDTPHNNQLSRFFGDYCILNYSKKCENNSVYWYDSCGKRGDVFQGCSANQICEDLICKDITCSTNQKCGTNSFVEGTRSCGLDNNVYQDFITYKCNLPGTSSSYCSDSTEKLPVQICDSGTTCSFGQCIFTACGSLAYQITNHINLYGYTTCSTENYNPIFDANKDKKIDASDVFWVKYVLTENQCVNQLENPENICCTLNYSQKCVGNSVYYFNSCNEQGDKIQDCTLDQLCQQGQCKDVACTTSNVLQKCGNNGFFGAKSCSADNTKVIQSYKTWSCLNPGETSASCNDAIDPARVFETCQTGFACDAGECKKVNCSTETQCGTDGYVGDLFCRNGDVWQSYKTFTCLDAGTSNSRCTDSSSPRLKTDCTANQTCTNGSCINNPSDFTVSATASPNPATTSQQVTFTPILSDENRNYSYIWTGDCVGINRTCQKTFTQSGTYTAVLTVTADSITKITSATVTVSQTVTSPSVQTNSATNITTNSVTLNGNITSLGGDSNVTVWFRWGTSSLYGNETTRQTLSSLQNFNHQLSGLASNTTYYYQAVIQNSNTTSYGQSITFTTTSSTTSSSVIANAGPDQYVNPGQNVMLYGSGSDSSGQSVTYSWNCNGGYLSNPNSAQTNFVASNINYNTNYYCTLVVRNASGVSASDDVLVRVNYINNNITSNNVQTNSATNITTNSATLNGYLYNNSNYNYNYNYSNYNNVWFQYGTSTNFGYETNRQALNYTGSFSQNISGLLANTTYYFRALFQDSSGQINYGQNMSFVTTGNQGIITVIKSVRNLSSGTNWANSVNAKPGDILSFMVVASVTGTSQNLSNVTLRDVLPGNLINRTNITVDNVVNYGDLNSGINVGYLSPSQMRTITYQVQVAPSSNFSFGNTTLTNYAYVTSSESSGTPAQASASVIVNKSGVLGATSVSTGLTNNFWLDSFFLPLAVALLGLWGYKSGILGIDEWVARRMAKTKNFRADKKLEEKLINIKQKESSWPKL